jgi:regulator of sigma E protease
MDGCPYEGEDGLMEGDTFWKINGERIYFSSDVSTYLARGDGEYADIVLVRDGKKVTLDHYPMKLLEYTDSETGETVMKYGLYFGVKEVGLGARLRYSWYCARDFVRLVRLGLTDLITGAVAVNQMTGVVGIVDMIADVGTQSPTVYDALLNIAYLSAFIAINLAVMNLLPLPALDGGRVFFLIVTWFLELILRRKIEPKYEGYINTAGLVLLMALMVYVMYNDIARIIAG